MIEVKAAKRNVFLAVTAANAPQIIEAIAAITSQGCQIAVALETALDRKRRKKARTATFTGSMKNAVTAVGLPSYTSAAHRWPGKAESLNINPTKMRSKPK